MADEATIIKAETESATVDPRPVAVLGMPSYGAVSMGAASAIYRASKKLNCCFFSYESSLLAQAFNQLWVYTLNMRQRGQRVDYFAMLHADVEPEPGWLDILVEKMEANNLDLLSAAVPIKSHKGITSTAIAKKGGDPWRVAGRLTLDEIHKLPEVFTAEDIGSDYELRLNTGCWVCKFDATWVDKVHFSINDRICFSEEEQLYYAQVEPEDWHFSRQLNQLGRKIGCTRAVKLNHRGQIAFGNDKAYGQSFDHEYREFSFLEESKPEFSWFPFHADGWLTTDEGTLLRELAEGKNCLEIGSYCGRSTICMANKAASIVAVDPFDGRATPNPRDTEAVFSANLKRSGVPEEKVRIVKGTTADYAANNTEDKFDLAFIDGAHDYESVKFDIATVASRLLPGGLIAFHDYDQPIDPDVKTAVDELLTSGWRMVTRRGSIAVLALAS